MGEKKNKTQRFLSKNPKCIFCGGGTNATTIEHCPPRALFQYKEWPEGFEFPACKKCNNDTSDEDLIIAVITRMCSPEWGNLDGKLIGMMKGLNNQRPEFYKPFLPSPAEARRNNKQLGVIPPHGSTHQEMGVVNITDDIRHAVETFSAKLAKAILWLECGLILKETDCLALNWFTNANVLKDGEHKVFNILEGILGNNPILSRQKSILNKQFQYKFSISDDSTLFLVRSMFGEAFGLAIFGCLKEGYLEQLLFKITGDLEKDYQPFKVIQGNTSYLNSEG